MRVELLKMHLMTGLNEPTHRKKRLVHFHDLRARDQRTRIAKLGDDVRALLAEIDENTAVGNFLLCPHLANANPRQIPGDVWKHHSFRRATVNCKDNPLPFRQFSNSADGLPGP